jgi:hypothetical protein
MSKEPTPTTPSPHTDRTAPTLLLRPVNAGVFGVHSADGTHLGNLKQIGSSWKFKAVGHDALGQVEPGGGPLTDGHNTVFSSPDADAVNAALARFLA